MGFLVAVAVAGIAFSAADLLDRRVRHLGRILPTPLLAGLAVAVVLLLLERAGFSVSVPSQGVAVDFLVALLTANMGLHLTPSVLRRGVPLFLFFMAAGLLLFWLQLGISLLFAWSEPHPLITALIAGPVSFLGAPYNLNPPSQVPPIAGILGRAVADPQELARGMMMIGIFGGAILASLLLNHLCSRIQSHGDAKPADDKDAPALAIDRFGENETRLLALIFGIVAAAFGIQVLIASTFPGFTADYLPVIVIAYLLGAVARCAFSVAFGDQPFPEPALTALLLGPTMGFVLTYAIMSIPLETVFKLPLHLAATAVAVIVATAAFALALFQLLRRFVDGLYAAVVATVFLAVTTGWGPVAMAFLRRVTEVQGRVEPVPAILPLNAFYVFPWMVIVLTWVLGG